MIRNLVRTKLWQSCACVSSRYHSSTISTVHQILNYDISDALVANRPELVRKKKVNRSTQFKMLEDKFKELFSFSQEEAVKLVDTNKSTWKIPLAKINANIDCLHKKNVRAQSIVDNLWLLGVPTSEWIQPQPNHFMILITFFIPRIPRGKAATNWAAPAARHQRLCSSDSRVNSDPVSNSNTGVAWSKPDSRTSSNLLLQPASWSRTGAGCKSFCKQHVHVWNRFW